jgi:nicotinic acid mononucleotide adenylyltransferase
MKLKDLKDLGISLHLIATGAGSGLIDELWGVPGCSAYLSGFSFPYSPEEQEEILGFMPDHFCNEGAAIDFASTAYMKAYRFGGKKPVGIGITASVASVREHRGKHRIFGCIITDDKVLSYTVPLEKGTGAAQRFADGQMANHTGLVLLNEAFDFPVTGCKDATELARARFFTHPFFTVDGKRQAATLDSKRHAIMAGAFNPPHQGHFGMAQACQDQYNRQVVYQITANTPHKGSLTVQELLKRAKLLSGHPRMFLEEVPLYLDKARMFPNIPLILGVDAMLRILDPKYSDVQKTLQEFAFLGTNFYIADREINGEVIRYYDLARLSPKIPIEDLRSLHLHMQPLEGRWDISSTEIRKTLQETK